MFLPLLDIHTHHPVPQPEGLVNIRVSNNTDFEQLKLSQSQRYSIGLHPWDIAQMPGEIFWESLEKIASGDNVKAIGECGIDLAKDIPLFLQLQIFNRQIRLAEKLGKPMIIHSVKSTDIICGLRRDLKPSESWAIHGFRGKLQPALQLIKAGCFISFGEKFNPETLKGIPEDKILAETDESLLSVKEIISNLSETKGKDLTDIVKSNSKKFLNFKS